MLDVKYNEAQFRAVQKRLDRFSAQMKNRTPANRQVSIELYGWCIRNFDRQGSLVGGWPPLAASTIREKQRIGKEQMMVRTGELRSGFNQFFDDEDAGIGNDIPYSVYHHSEEPRTKLPRRQLLPGRKEVLEIGVKVYQNYVSRAVKQANRR